MSRVSLRSLLVAGLVFGFAHVAQGQVEAFPTQQSVPLPTPTAPPAGMMPVDGQLINSPSAFNMAAPAPPPGFDPFASSVATQPTLYAESPFGAMDGPGMYVTTAVKFFQRARFEYTWMPGNGGDELGIHDISINGSFAIPFFKNPETPLLVTPGFALHLFSGPKDAGVPSADLPSSVYDAYLDLSWMPRLSPVVGGELNFRIGVYSDFEKATSDALRMTGAGYFVVCLSPGYTVKAGVQYLDRNQVKILPSGGLIITPAGPDGDVRLEILFPNPKLAMRIPNSGPADWWGYVRMDYGGSNWAIKRTDGSDDTVDYNDIRLAIGFESQGEIDVTSIFELGVAFNRELVYRSHLPRTFGPNSTIFIRAALFF